VKAKVADDLNRVWHTFGPINIKEHFPENELTLGKSRLLEMDILVC